ncbi:hypothetical protein, partial [Azospirillum sp. Sp 7]|uniref:hypothetical protein n=1 Tax=Azospirillum sp. Sp 7 TaxID=1685931 RepID=UPI001B3B7930
STPPVAAASFEAASAGIHNLLDFSRLQSFARTLRGRSFRVWGTPVSRPAMALYRPATNGNKE